APPLAKSFGEVTCRLVAALDAAVVVRRDIGDDVRRRPGHAWDDELGGNGCEAAEPALLPRPHRLPHRCRVWDRRPRGVERNPAAGALGALLHGPRGRRAAPGARRRPEAGQRCAATIAE